MGGKRLTQESTPAAGFGSYVRNLRLERGMSLSEFGSAIGVARQTVSNWEMGRAWPRRAVVLRIAKATGISLAELVKPLFSEDAS